MELVNAEYEINKSNPEKAVENAIAWWQKLETPPSSEDLHINIWGISNKKILSKLKNNELSENELFQVLNQNYARQIKNKTFGLDQNYKTNIDERVKIFVHWLINQKTDVFLHEEWQFHTP